MKPKSHLLRNLVFGILIIIFVWYIFSHHEEFSKFIEALRQGSWLWLVVAGITQALYYTVYTFMTKSAFKTVHLHRKFIELVPLVFGSLFVNVLAPTGGQSGTILYADDAARRKESSPKAIIASVITTIVGYMAFSSILVFSLVYLKRAGLLNNYEIIGSIIFIFPTIIPGILIFTSYRFPKFTLKVTNWVYRLVKSFTKLIHRPSKISPAWPTNIARELTEAAHLVRGNKKQLIITLFIALIAHAVSIVSLFVIFLAFDYKIHYGALIAGYAFGEVARVISPQPEGIGVVEVVMVVIFTSFGVPPIQATAISIVFRGLNFWAPLGLGFALLKTTKSFSGKSA